jgi:L,D-transpeptidase YbiS
MMNWKIDFKQMISNVIQVSKIRMQIKAFAIAMYSFVSKQKLHLGFLILIVLIPIAVRFFVWQTKAFSPNLLPANNTDLQVMTKSWERELATMDIKLQKKRPKSYFLIINSASNEFELYKGNTQIKKDKCSTGSYILLKNDDQQQWMFKTPKGEFRIQGKTTSPVWKKPDWAFIEEGLPVPPANHYTRFEYGVLGDYALSLGHGYLIHGTLYQRFLGLPVTHGCIRLNDKNLELVYKSLPIGSKVYIY